MKKILEIVIVDDEVQITELLKTFITCTFKECKVYTFNDSDKARNFLLEKEIDVLITDYKMDKYNGIDLIEILPPSVEKILISGYVSEIAEERLRQLNATFFEKPVPMKLLEKIILEKEKTLADTPPKK